MIVLVAARHAGLLRYVWLLQGLSLACLPSQVILIAYAVCLRKIGSERNSSGSKEPIKETEVAAVLFNLFMCSNVMVQHSLRP